MDHFMEEIVVKKNKTFDEIVYYVSAVIMVILALFAMIYLQFLFMDFHPITLVETLIAGGGAVLIFLRRDRLRKDYEYTFTNGEMDFAQVFNNKKRKTLGTMRVKNVDAFGPVNGNAFQRYLSMPNVKRENWFLNRGSELYFFFFTKEGSKRMIIIEPSTELVDMIKKYLPMNIYQG